MLNEPEDWAPAVRRLKLQAATSHCSEKKTILVQNGLYHKESMLQATVLGPSLAAAPCSIATEQVPTTSAALCGFAGAVSLCTPSASQELPGLMPSLPGAGIVSVPRCFLPPSC